MRSSKSRSRSKANRPRSLGNIINRVFDSSGPEGKVRGTPQQIIEKYQILARDAQLSNDRVAAENFMQHAEHYTRLLSEAQRELAAEQEERQRQQGQGGGQQQNGNRDRDGNWRDRNDTRDWRGDRDEDGSSAEVIDLSGPDDNLVETPEARPQQGFRRDDRGDQRRDERPRDERPRDDRPRDDRPREERGERRRDDRPRDDRPRDDRPRDDRPREDRGERRRDDRPRDDRPRDDRPRDDRPRDDRPREDRREPRPDLPPVAAEAAPQPMVQPAVVTDTAPVQAEPQAEKPKKPRAPRKPKGDNPDGTGGGSQEAAE